MNILCIGGSSGIGAELRKLLCTAKANLHLISRTKPDDGNYTTYTECDVTKDALPTLIDDQCDGLVYLPGTINLSPFARTTDEQFYEEMNINFFSAVRAIRQYSPKLSHSSSIVLLSSVAASIGFPYHTSIAGAKGALEGFSRSLAAELAPKTRVNCVAPSLTETPLSKKILDQKGAREASIKKHPMHSIGSTADIASAIYYLLTPASSWITGQIFHVDGGISTIRGL